MIIGKNNKSARILFNWYLNRLLRRNFSNFYLLNEMPDFREDLPLIIAPNHFSWWDGFLLDYSLRQINSRELFIMMLETQLKKYWFFRYVGAFSIDPGKIKSIIEAGNFIKVNAAANNCFAIYPQGTIEPFGPPVQEIKEGLRYFAQRITEGCSILPVAFKIQYEEQRLPAVYMRFGSLLTKEEIRQSFSMFREQFIRNIELLDQGAKERKYARDIFGAFK